MAVPFDLRKLQVTGDPVALIENVMQSANMAITDNETAAGQFAISETGTLSYLTGGVRPFGESSLVLLNRKGEILQSSLPAPEPSIVLGDPRFSPDQRSLVATHFQSPRQGDVWAYDLHGTGPHRVTFTQTNPYAAIWSPDGKRVVYSSDATGLYSLYVVNADGSSRAERLTFDNEYQQFASSWTSAGNVIVFMRERLPAISELWTLHMDDKKIEPFVKNPAPGIRLQYPEFSPDGHWIAYVSNESGQNEVWVRAYPQGSASHKISAGGAAVAPIWTSGGKELLYRSTAGGLQSFFSVAITSLNPFQSAPPKKLFEVERPGYSNQLGIRDWDATSDGQRFLLVRAPEEQEKPVHEFEIILNWTDELSRRVRPK